MREGSLLDPPIRKVAHGVITGVKQAQNTIFHNLNASERDFDSIPRIAPPAGPEEQHSGVSPSLRFRGAAGTAECRPGLIPGGVRVHGRSVSHHALKWLPTR